MGKLVLSVLLKPHTPCILDSRLQKATITMEALSGSARMPHWIGHARSGQSAVGTNLSEG